MWRTRGLSTVASFAIFLTAFAVIVLSLFYFYNFLMSATQKGVAAVYSAVTVDQETSFNASTAGGQLTCWLGGSGIYYVVADGKGRLVYNGTEPRCPPGPGEYVYKAVRRDGGVYLAKVYVGNVTLSPRVNATLLYVDDYYRSVTVPLYVDIYNPSDGYAVFTNFTAKLYDNNQYINCSEKSTKKPVATLNRTVVVPPRGSASLYLGDFVCNVNVTNYLYRAGAPPTPVYAWVNASYNGALVASANAPVATVSQRPLKGGSFNYTGSVCVVRGASQPLYYVLLSDGAVVSSGPATGGSVACPPGEVGNYTYRVVDGGGYIVTVDVVVDKVRVWAEADRTVAYVNSTHNSTIFNLYLRFTNPNPGYTPLNFEYSLIYDTRLLQCSMVNGVSSRSLTLAPGETLAKWVGTFRCNVTSDFWSYNSTTVSVYVRAWYGSVTLYEGVVGQPGFLPANWVVLKVVAGRGVESPGKSVFAVAQGPGLVRFIAARPPAPAPYCPPFYLTPNSTIFPLLAVSGLTFRLKFMPGWWEDYVVGRLSDSSPAQLVKTGEGGSPGYYEIWLGPNLQLTPAQSSGSPTPLPAPVRWATRSSAAYWVTANATAGNCSQAVANFTVVPMSRLASWAFSCPTQQIYENFGNYTTYSYGFDRDTDWIDFYYEGGRRTRANFDNNVGNPAPSIHLRTDKGWVASFFNISRWIGPKSASNCIYSIQLFSSDKDISKDVYVQVNFFIDANGDGKPDVEKVYYFSPGATPVNISKAVYGYSLPYTTVYLGKPFARNTWVTVQFTPGGGYVVGMAVVAYWPGGRLDLWTDNLAVMCAPGPNVVVYTGYSSTVYASPTTSPTSPPSLVTEAVPTDDLDYAVAQYWLPQPIPVLGTSISVWGLYARNTGDVQNNAAYVSVGVDTDGDGTVDREYIFYRSDGPATIVSAFISPGTVVCQGTCVNTTQYVFYNLGTMASGSKYQWQISLSGPGAVLAVAMAAVDGGGSGGFKVYWDDLTVTYSACPPPAGWTGRGYAWVSYNYLLVTAGGMAYTSLVAGALTYVANFTGTGKYVALTSTLGEAFGLYLRGSSAGCVYGYYSPSSQYVELRPLAALGDVIVRDSSGNVLARFGCAAPPSAQYIGFKAGPGEYLVVRTVEAWG